MVNSRAKAFVRPPMWKWIVGSAVSGVVAALLFGGLLWIINAEIVSEFIPAVYGLQESPLIGWVIHLSHGAILGLIFGLIVTREAVFDMLTGPVETDVIASFGAGIRFGLTGLVYGIALFAILPFIGLTLLGTVADIEEVGFTGVAAEMFLGHVVFGIVIGVIFSLFVAEKSSRDAKNLN